MPTIREAVEQAANPQEALLAIADGLDTLLMLAAAKHQTSSDSWGEWPAENRIPDLPPKPAMEVTVDDGAAEVVFAEAPPEVKAERAALMTERFPLAEALEGQLEADEALQAYITGGPLWLREFDRGLVLQMPTNIRQAMVQDVLSYDPEAADELGRDILKVTDMQAGLPDWHPAVTGDA